MDSGLAALIGALIGGFTTLAATWSVELWRQALLARKHSLAASSEVEAALWLVGERGWRKAFADYRDAAMNGRALRLVVHNQETYLPLTRLALTESGAIDLHLTKKMARLCLLENGLLSDLRRLADFPPEHPNSLINLHDPEQVAQIYQGLIDLLDAAVAEGNEVIRRVEDLYVLGVGAKLHRWLRPRPRPKT